ncbi:hypothetical protein [Mesorhizobium sp. M0816]|uniref:hypothetical protein n=1 Tax=Mesorhizobium sp. M0816 TaxID=2957006 RepID=UPI003337644B
MAWVQGHVAAFSKNYEQRMIGVLMLDFEFRNAFCHQIFPLLPKPQRRCAAALQPGHGQFPPI